MGMLSPWFPHIMPGIKVAAYKAAQRRGQVSDIVYGLIAKWLSVYVKDSVPINVGLK